MNPLQQTKLVACVPPAAILDDASATAVEIDTLGFDFCQVIVTLGASDIAMAALKLQESDVSGSGFADIDGLDCDGDTTIDGTAAALPSATDDNKIVVLEADMRGRKRFLKLVATAGNGSAGTYLSAVALLSRGDVTPVTQSERGCDTVLRV